MRRGTHGQFRGEIVRNRADGLGADDVAFVEKRREHQPRAQYVDPTRHPARGLVNKRKGVVVNPRIVAPSDRSKSVVDIGAGLALRERSEVVRRNDALPQLLQLRPADDDAKLRLAKEETLEKRLVPRGEVGKHAQLFEGTDRQILGLVDEQQ